MILLNMERALYLVVIFLLTSYSSALYSSKELERYPNGYLSDCPGSTKPAFITPRSLKHLSIIVAGRYQSRSYNYYQMKQLYRQNTKSGDLDMKRKTLLWVGGFLDSPGFILAKVMTQLYKDFGYNVLLLDTNFFTTREYPIASRFMRTVGKHVAEMLTELTKLGLNPANLELLGISLGAHTMSFIGKNYQLLNQRKISRMTGLDPAGPCFRNLGPKDRLDQSDAEFVDLVLTNIDGFGMAAPVGHVNFYVNGGEYQPGDFLWVPCNILCSHVRSFTLWYSSFYNPTKFVAMKCESVQQARFRNCFEYNPLITNLLGPNTDRNKTGIFYLSTDNNFPYYLGDKGLKREYEFFNKKLTSLNADDVITI